MLSIEALEASLPLAQLLDRAGVVVTPVPNTPLAMMVQATRSDSMFANQGPSGDIVVNVQDIVAVANAKDEAGVNDHSNVTDGITNMAVAAVKKHLAIIRGGVTPVICDLHDNVVKKMADVSASSLLGMEVKIYDLPKPIRNPALANFVEKYGDAPISKPALTMKCPVLPYADIVELMKTGAAGLDRDIVEWAAVQGETWVLQAWETVFRGFHGPQDSNFRLLIADQVDGLNRALFIFLVARKLAESAELQGIEMSLAGLKALAQEYRDQAAAEIARSIDRWETTKKGQFLVRKFDGKAVIVNEVVYREWIKAGGENEVLFGALVAGGDTKTVPQINERAAQFKAAWVRHVSMTGMAERTARFTTLKRFLSAEFRRQLNETVEGEVDINAHNREVVMKRFKAELDCLKENECDNLYAICTRLVCRARFYQTGAEDFLADMEQLKSKYPSCEVRELATLASVKYVAKWIASQFRVDNITA